MLRNRLFPTLVVISLFVISLIMPQTGYAQDTNTISKDTKEFVVTQLSKLLTDAYVFPETGRKLSDYIKTRFDGGQYDHVDSPEAFAELLTTDLQSRCNDRHLVVAYSPTKASALMKPSDSDGAPSEEYLNARLETRRRDNFGFKKVENLPGNVGYLKLDAFYSPDNAGETAAGAMAFIAHSDAVIIDLRDNRGGGAGMYTLICSYFFDDTPVHLGSVYFRPNDSTTEFRTLEQVQGKRMPDVDLYILTGSATFSAAEEFAYDLQQLNRATIVGITTQGGAHMAQAMPINDEFFAYIPIAAAINPITGTNWEGVGVKPDVEVPEEEAFITAYKLALEKLVETSSNPVRRRELLKVLSELHEQ